MKTFLCVVITIVCVVFAVPRPMEALNRYNVILVHGAAPEEKGFESECNSDDIYDADMMMSGHLVSPQTIASQLGGAAGMLGDYENEGEKKLTYWLDSAVFEDYQYRNGKIYMDSTNYRKSPYIYIQRSFANPAASPAHNAHEIGDRTWKGNNKCSVRRSLFEEAQEVRAEGKNKLQQLRTNSVDEYRTIPSRNILIAHSMGGVASHEYVTDTNVYNNDVDKVITLDSPHEGTGSLNLLIDMRKYGRQFGEASVQYMLAWATVAIIAGKDPVSQTIATEIVAATYGMSTINRLVTLAVDEFALKDDYAFKEDDPLSKYIFPGADGITALKNRPLNENMPMIRLLAGKGGMTFSDPNEGYGKYLLNFVMPEALSAPIGNIATQLIDGDGSDAAIYVNSVTGLALGFLGGITLQDVGTTLIPEESGLAENTVAFKDEQADVRRFTFDAAAHANDTKIAPMITANVITLGWTVSTVLAADVALSAFPVAQSAAKLGAALAGAGLLTLSMMDSGVEDIKSSHENAKTRRMLDTLYSADFSYTKVKGGNESGRIRLMEDFLYERPFVNLGLFVSDSTLRAVEPGCYYESDKVNKQQLCEVGLFGAGGKVVSSNGKKNYSEFRKGDLKFKSESDWSQMGVKIDRWEKVDGLHPDGSENKKGVPIRHVERYEVPAITVEDWIEKYSFVVDDLMPHRLRQIRMNFNFVSEIAWECDITKSENDKEACDVYKRSAGEPWGKSFKKVPHPVKKNGQFDFVPDDYGIKNKFSIQKDNQNTVVISTVNKIGLSNTQRFYYLFKATENVLKSNWPERDVVLNRIEGFEAFASVTDYQGFRVDSAYDIVYKGDDIEHGTRLRMRGIPNGAQDMDFNSLQQMDTLSDGEYTWQFRAYATNNTSGDVDSAKFYNASFSLDRVAPKFSLYTDNSFVNPDNANFIVRYKWNGGASTTPDVRVMRWNLDSACTFAQGDTLVGDAECSGSISLPAMYDVAAREFAISWDKIPANVREKLTDGLYRVKAYALDYAVPNRLMYDSVNALVDRIMSSPNDLTDADWKLVIDSSGTLNDTTVYAMFRVDKTAPVVTDITSKAVAAVDTVGMSPATGFVFTDLYASLPRPARNNNDVYVAEDSLLEISYKVKETSSGEDSALALLAWDFEHVGDSLKIDRAGDSVWVKSGFGSASWKELSGLHLVDGVYKIRVKAHDRAGNMSSYDAPKLVRVDRTAPNITSLVSRRLVYPDSDRAFSATIKVNQLYDADSNRTGMYCYYRVSGGDADRVWRSIMRDGRDSLLSADSIDFAINAAAVGSENGVRYLESVCIDAAGNSAVRTDLFHVGFRSPNIVYPVTDKTESSERLIPIVGVAPPPFVE